VVDRRGSEKIRERMSPGAVSQTGSRHYFRFRDVRPERDTV
jgi:hypothetical protein